MEQAIVEKKISPTMALIKNAFKIYTERFWSFVGIGLVPILGAIPLILLAVFFFISLLIKDKNIALVIAIISLVLGLAAVIVCVYIACAAQAGFILMLKNSSAKLGEAFQAGRNYAWPLLVVGLLTNILVLLWSILFIIPGIIFALYYSMGNFVLVVEDKRNMSALKRSKELVQNYWWPVLGRYCLIYLIAIIVMMILSWPLNMIKEHSVIFIILSLVVDIFNFLFGQFLVIFSYLIFKDLQQIKA
ncbi:MAG: hypothetical protein PHS62_05225 [Patescibacteria group bacterium]|nr:hypothetical protein [Patescibacteria group bacterium]